MNGESLFVSQDVVGDSNVTPIIKGDPPNTQPNGLMDAADESTGDKNIGPVTTIEGTASFEISQPPNSNTNTQHVIEELVGQETMNENLITSFSTLPEISSTDVEQPSNTNLDDKHIESEAACNEVDDNEAPSLTGEVEIASTETGQPSNSITDVKNLAMLQSDEHNKNTILTTSQTANDNSGQPLINQKANTDDFHKQKITCQSEVKGPLRELGENGTLQSYSGAAKRRFKHLIALNFDVQEASKLCLKTWTEIASLVNVPLNINQVGNDKKQIQNKSTNLATTKIANDNSGQSFNKKKAKNDGIHNVKITNQRKDIAPPAGSSKIGGKQLTPSEQKSFNLLIKCGLRSRAARKLCVDPERAAYIVRKFKREQRQNSQNPLPSPFTNPMKNKKSSPTGKIIMSYKDHNMRTDSRGFERNDSIDYQRTQSNDYGRYYSTRDRMDFVNHVSPRSSKFSVDQNRTHPRDNERYDSTSHMMDFMDHASSSKYFDSTEYMGYPRGPPTRYTRLAPPDHARTDPMEISPRSMRQDCLENSESSKVKIVNRRGLMTKNEMKAIHKSLLSAIINTGGDGAGPKFQALIPMNGWISVTCCNKQSHNWLQLNVPMLRPWPGADLLVVSGNEIFATACFPKSETESIDLSLRLLKVQNEGLQTDLWRVMNFREDKEGIFIKFSMDESSADTLYKLRGNVTLGFSNIHFNFIEKE